MESEICIICYENIEIKDHIIFDNCLHGDYVHILCIKNWNNTCPICRAPIYKSKYNLINIIYNYIIYLIKIIIDQFNNETDVINYIITTR